MLSLTLAQEQHAARGPLTVEFGLMFWTIVVFVALLVILRKFAWPAILGAVEARERALEEQLAEAERNRAEAARLLAEHQKLLAEGRTAAHGLLAEARTAAEKERERAVAELRREAVDLSLAAASKLIGERLNSENDRKIVQEYLASLGSNH